MLVLPAHPEWLSFLTLICPSIRSSRTHRFLPFSRDNFLNAPSLFQSLIAPFGMQHFSYMPSFGILGTYLPTPCGLATFSAALAGELTARGADVDVVRIPPGDVSDGPNVAGELVTRSGSPSEANCH